MNCPVCNRNNAVTLSICPSCGAMINDSVRKELVPKISNHVKPLGFELKENKMMPNKTAQPANSAAEKPAAPPRKPATTEITMKTTSPTLVEFHSRNATIPEWRLQLQNVVRQRQERETTVTAEILPPAHQSKFVTSGATALKPETIQAPKTIQHKNPTLNSALSRIENSRRQFLSEEKPQASPIAAPPAKASKNYPFYIAGKTNDAVSKPAEINQPVNSFAKPKLASSLRTEPEKLDTNKLPPIPTAARTAADFENPPAKLDDVNPLIEETVQTKIELTETVTTKVELTKTVEVAEAEEVQEFDDCAPFALRFNAGLFDLIIGSFVSLLLLSPFMLFGGNWLSVAGVFAFLATGAIVMFVYMTAAIGFYGRTFGMRLFSLEIVDIESEDYPTFHQAAVSSAVYLLSLALGGIGFLTLAFNDDKRAVHDIVSGTIIVKEE